MSELAFRLGECCMSLCTSIIVMTRQLEESREGLEEDKLFGVRTTSPLWSELQDLSRIARWDMILASSGKADTSYSVISV